MGKQMKKGNVKPSDIAMDPSLGLSLLVNIATTLLVGTLETIAVTAQASFLPEFAAMHRRLDAVFLCELVSRVWPLLLLLDLPRLCFLSLPARYWRYNTKLLYVSLHVCDLLLFPATCALVHRQYNLMQGLAGSYGAISFAVLGAHYWHTFSMREYQRWFHSLAYGEAFPRPTDDTHAPADYAKRYASCYDVTSF
jgi:hypothetical protein